MDWKVGIKPKGTIAPDLPNPPQPATPPQPTTAPTTKWVHGVKPTTPRKEGYLDIGFQRQLQLEDLKFDALLELGSGNLPGQPHYFGQWVVKFYSYWKYLYPNSAPTINDPRDGLLDPFYEWLKVELNKQPLDPSIERILTTNTDENPFLQVKEHDTTKHNLTARQRFLAGVKYISREADRKKYEIKFKAGLMYRGVNAQGQKLLFDTSKLSTVSKGRDWAIWVQGPDFRFYSHSHKVARFHHSSFLAGGAVLTAGEWKVSNGRITRINAKSGHYQPGMRGFYTAVKRLKNLGVCGQDCKVMLYERNAGSNRCRVALIELQRFLQDSWQTWLINYLTDINSTELPPVSAYGNRPPAAHANATPATPATNQSLSGNQNASLTQGPNIRQNDYLNRRSNIRQNTYLNHRADSSQNAYLNNGANSGQSIYFTGGGNNSLVTGTNDQGIVYFTDEVVAYQN